MNDLAKPDTGVSVFGLTVDMGAYEFQNPPSGTCCEGDLNLDGWVNLLDFATLPNNFQG